MDTFQDEDGVYMETQLLRDTYGLSEEDAAIIETLFVIANKNKVIHYSQKG